MKLEHRRQAPITSEWSTILLPTKVRLILEVWGYSYFCCIFDSNSLKNQQTGLNWTFHETESLISIRTFSLLHCIFVLISWWRHQMETFSALLAIGAGNSPVTGEFPTQRPVTQSFDVFFDLRPNKRLSKQWWGWWFETPSYPLWRHCEDYNPNGQHYAFFVSAVVVSCY